MNTAAVRIENHESLAVTEIVVVTAYGVNCNDNVGIISTFCLQFVRSKYSTVLPTTIVYAFAPAPNGGHQLEQW